MYLTCIFLYIPCIYITNNYIQLNRKKYILLMQYTYNYYYISIYYLHFYITLQHKIKKNIINETQY